MDCRGIPHDAVIVGGGMVGAALAADLGQRGWRVGLVEARPPRPIEPDSAYRLRVSALNRRATAYLDRLGAWHRISATRACPYDRLSVWDGPGRARLTFRAEEFHDGARYLGHIVENELVQGALWAALDACPGVVRYETPCSSRLAPSPFGACLDLDDGRRLHGDLIVAADGAHSRLRQAAGIPLQVHDYRQSAVVVQARTRTPQQQSITWQRFTAEGPQAFLPLAGPRASLVWYTTPDRARHLADLPAEQLREALEAAFPAELGGLEAVEQRASFPIRAQHAYAYAGPGLVLVGDAAHTIHPLAGQGVNLGFRDAEALGRLLAEAANRGQPPDDPTVLSAYARERRRDNQLMQSSMTAIRAGFEDQRWPLPALRQCGLRLAQHAGPAKRLALRYACEGPPLG